MFADSDNASLSSRLRLACQFQRHAAVREFPAHYLLEHILVRGLRVVNSVPDDPLVRVLARPPDQHRGAVRRRLHRPAPVLRVVVVLAAVAAARHEGTLKP